jgi:hypothetical protein
MGEGKWKKRRGRARVKRQHERESMRACSKRERPKSREFLLFQIEI